MKRRKPDDLHGPRAYFTGFDPEIVARSADQSLLRLDCERRLKLLLLLKTRLVCAASHLRSPVAIAVFRDYPFLLEEGHVLPALRNDKPSISSAFRAHDDVARFYEDHVTEVVDWQLQENSAWFRERFLEELANPTSVVRLNTSALSDEAVADFRHDLEGTDLLDRASISRWAGDLSASDRSVVLAFRELLYHVSGARVVRCEGSLPQEEYLDFDLADLTQGRTRLSEHLVFWKIFVDQALASLQLRAVSFELLDILEFKDIVTLRQPLLENGFQAKYDELSQTAIGLIRGPDAPLVEGVEKLENVRRALEETFREIFERELPAFIKKKGLGSKQEMLSNSSSIALGLLGLVPVVGTAASAVALAKDSRSLYFNIASMRETPSSLEEVVAEREQAVRRIAQRLAGSDGAFLDVVDAITATLRERMRLL